MTVQSNFEAQIEKPDVFFNNYSATCLKDNPFFKSFLISCKLRSSFFNQSVLMCSHKFTLEFQPQSMENSFQVGIIEWRQVYNFGHTERI